MKYEVPFISNTAEDKQCLQAAYGMIRNYFEPDLEMSWDEWSAITGYLPGKGTWSMAGLLWFKERGYSVIHIADFDYAALATEGEKYLIKLHGEELAQWEINNMDMATERTRATLFQASNISINRKPKFSDIKAYLDKGYLVKCQVNLNALNEIPGYTGHAVVVTGYTSSGLIIHDPGLPARPDRYVGSERFIEAWINPETQSAKMDAIFRAAPAQLAPVIA